jgi:hypothetical protein
LALDVSSIVLVIVNGGHHDEDVLQAVSDAGAVVHHVGSSGVSEARRIGRERVLTPLFGFLDDDDILLPTAGTERCRYFSDPSIAMVVTNGYWVGPDGRPMPLPQLPTRAADGPLLILQNNWLASSAAFFRASAVTPADFANLPNVMEWTTLGFRLALRLNIKYSPAFTYALYQDAPRRSTSTRPYVEDAPYVLRQLKKETTRRDLLRRLNQKIRAAHHAAADYCLRRADLRSAWRHHLASLRGTGLWRYAGFTRHLLRRHWRPLLGTGPALVTLLMDKVM